MTNWRVSLNNEPDVQVVCGESRCGWRGKRSETDPGYVPDGGGDVEPADLCPKCGREVMEDEAGVSQK